MHTYKGFVITKRPVEQTYKGRFRTFYLYEAFKDGVLVDFVNEYSLSEIKKSLDEYLKETI